MANATAALAVAGFLGLDLHASAEALSSFGGAYRRFTHVGDIDSVTVVDDYGHHPTEIAATLKAARDLDFKRIICVFQPHRYTRTQALAKMFGHAFDDADVLLVMDVFPAGEMPIPGISGKTVVTSVTQAGGVSQVAYIPNRKKLVAHLMSIVRPGDLVITQGAGDVTQIGPAFLAAMRERDEEERN
jgi:UDP-N-acetylmuramate--alanine ligase